MFKKPLHLAIAVIWLAVLGCYMPGFGAQATAPPSDGNEDLILTITALAGNQPAGAPTGTTEPPPPPPGATATLTLTATTCPATITAPGPVNVRSGPGAVYDIIGSLPAGASANVDGKNAEGTWWYVVFPAGAGGHAWVSGSVVTANCIPTTLAIIAAPPTPRPVSGTCKDGYVWRLINPSDKICVTPASKAQADADNAAAESRKLVTFYGSLACKVGYVWRDAYPDDFVCVTPAVHDQAQADNTAAASRWTPGPYGAHTCISGFVWREARPGDDVCVTPDVHTQTADDNAAASSRVAGPNDCISGYVWREAFSGDYVCVTPAVKAQVAADNAAAPSHTWP